MSSNLNVKVRFYIAVKIEHSVIVVKIYWDDRIQRSSLFKPHLEWSFSFSVDCWCYREHQSSLERRVCHFTINYSTTKSIQWSVLRGNWKFHFLFATDTLKLSEGTEIMWKRIDFVKLALKLRGENRFERISTKLIMYQLWKLLIFYERFLFSKYWDDKYMKTSWDNQLVLGLMKNLDQIYYLVAIPKVKTCIWLRMKLQSSTLFFYPMKARNREH